MKKLSADIELARRIRGPASPRVVPLLESIVIVFAFVVSFTVAFTTVFAFAPGVARAQADAIAIATLIPYAEKAEVRDSIRQECGLSFRLSKSVLARSAKKEIPMIRLGNPNETQSVRGEAEASGREGATGHFRSLELRITDAIETSGGILPTHSLSIDGVLKENGRIVGTFVATRFARASFIPFRRGECAILSEAATMLAKDMVRWLKKPSLDSRLGDAR